jgi:hypothetical protein
MSGWLGRINRDRSYGLSNFCAFSARNRFFWSIIAWVYLLIFYVAAMDDDAKLGAAAIVLGGAVLLVFSPPIFSRRSYPMIVKDENVAEPSRLPHSIKELLYFGLAFSGSTGVTFLTIYYDRKSDIVVKGSAVFGTSVMSTAVFYLIVPRIVYWRQRTRDKVRFSLARSVAYRSRIGIAETFASFESADGRELYVDWLGDQGFVPTEEWPSGRPPNLGDAASTKLAKLEHRASLAWV